MNRQFTALSGIAMVLIVINHSIAFGIDYPQQLGYPATPEWLKDFLSILQSFGWFAVPIFFFISGCFVAYAAQGNPGKLSRKFMLSTLEHICIPYLIWSVVFYIFIYLFLHQSYNLFGYIKNLLVGYPYHFVPLLVFYYLISPILIRIGRNHGLLLLLLIALYQFFLITLLNPGVASIAYPDWAHYLAPPVIRTTLADWAIYFPLGLVYGLTAKSMLLWCKKLMWWTTGAAILLFILGNLDVLGVIHFPLARFICPVSLMFLLPVIKREKIPLVRQFERIGKRSYGIYLTHLVALNLVLVGIGWFIPALFTIYVIYFPLLFIIALLIPLWIMEWTIKSPVKQYSRYVFG